MVEAGVAFVREFGPEALPKVAKLHFATTATVLREERRRPPHRAHGRSST